MKIFFYLFRLFVPLYVRGVIYDALIEKKRKCRGFESNTDDWYIINDIQSKIMTKKDYIKYQEEIR